MMLGADRSDSGSTPSFWGTATNLAMLAKAGPLRHLVIWNASSSH